VFEVGLGGELDATNVVTPEVSVITSIGRDHEEYLGNEIEKIAAAKGGIIKPGIPVVIGRLPPAAECVIREIAEEKRAPVISVRDEFGDDLAKYPRTNLEGNYQRWNAATAVLASRALSEKWKISEALIDRGLREVVWPGRWQRLQIDGRRLILDASHNADGAAVLAENLAALVAETGKRPIIITGVLGLDRARPLIEVIGRFAREIHFVVPNQPRACTHAELTALVANEFKGNVVRASVPELFPSAGICTAGGKDDVVVVTGSIYLLGEVISRLAVELLPA
jgi:dihydrofolate synthase/folylpolyglutamate synthase